FAAWLLGIAVVPVKVEEDDKSMKYILEKVNIELIFVHAPYRERVNDVLESDEVLKHTEVVVCKETTENYSKTEGELKLEQESLSESTAFIIFTSGSNCEPRGVVLTQRNLLENARSIGQWHHIDENTRMMGVLPIQHVNGAVVSLVIPFF